MHPLVRTLLTATLLVPALAACGQEAPATPAATSSGTAAAFPVTLPQPTGSVTIAEQPKRVFVIDDWSLDVVAQLGVTPVGALTYLPPPPWVTELPAMKGVEPITMGENLPIEKVAAADPDVIVSISYGQEPAVMKKLEAIAPVVQAPGDINTVGWRERVEQVGKALGRTTEAAAAIARADTTIAEIRSANPALSGATLTFGRFDAPSSFALVVDDSDFTRAFMNTELGVTTPPAQLKAFSDGSFPKDGGVMNGVSLERLDLVDGEADAALIWFPGGEQEVATLEKLPLWRDLPVVAEDRLVVLSTDAAIALRSPTPAAIAWAAKDVFPSIAAAVQR